jgi:hypothetical protein
MSRSAIVLYVSTLVRQLPEIGDVPKSPVPILAALVPSVGTLMLQTKSLVREQVP